MPSFVGLFRVAGGGDIESRAACTSSNGEIVFRRTGVGGFENGSCSCSD